MSRDAAWPAALERVRANRRAMRRALAEAALYPLAGLVVLAGLAWLVVPELAGLALDGTSEAGR